MGRSTRRTLLALLAVGGTLVAVTSASGLASTTGSERSTAVVVSGASGKHTVVGRVIALSGVFSGVGRIVERPNKPGDSNKVDRDDVMFAAGSFTSRA